MKRLNIMIVLMIFHSLINQVSAQGSAFLQIGDIKGESMDKDHKDWIIIESMSYGIHESEDAPRTRLALKRVDFKPLVISKKLDKSSPSLMLKCASGKYIDDAILELTDGNGKTLYTYRLYDVYITNIKMQSSCILGCEVREEVSLNYSKIKWEYKDDRGRVISEGWDVKSNRAF